MFAWAARLDLSIVTLPYGTAEWLEDITVMATLGAVVGLVIGLVAMAVWCMRRMAIGLAQREHDRLRRSAS